jgi:predicted secreted protein
MALYQVVEVGKQVFVDHHGTCVSFEAFMVVIFWIVVFWVLTLNTDISEEHVVSMYMVKVCIVRNQLHCKQVVMEVVA